MMSLCAIPKHKIEMIIGLPQSKMNISTYLMNSTKKEYIFLGSGFPEMIGKHLLILEKACGWNLHRDDIAVRHTAETFGYKDVGGFIYNVATPGGEIIHEELKLY